MVDLLAKRSADAKDFRVPLPGLRRIGTFVPVAEVGSSGSRVGTTLKFVRHEEKGAIQRPEIRLGGAGQAGPGIGEARPIAAQPFSEPTPIFISPLGEQRI